MIKETAVRGISSDPPYKDGYHARIHNGTMKSFVLSRRIRYQCL